MACFTSHEVYRSDEFKAFCQRFGIAWELGTTELVIYIPNEGTLEVLQNYRPMSIRPGIKFFPVPGSASKDESKSDVIETTTKHNQVVRTFQPAGK